VISRLLLRLSLAGLVVVPAVQPRAFAQLPPSLTADQRARIERGDAVQILEPAEDGWPASRIYQVINATPEQSAAVLSDYALQAKYIPRMKSAKVLRQVGPDVDVEYVIDIPVYPDERSVSRQRVIRVANGYRIRWNTLVDSTTKASVTNGSATFLPYTRAGRPATLLIHWQVVQPASMFAKVPFVKSKAIQASVESVEAIRKQVEKEVSSDPQLLKVQMMRLKSLAVDSVSSR
jgi:hypothetical protein